MKQNFNLPLNSLKRETSVLETIHFVNTDIIQIGETELTGFRFSIDKRVHRNNPKIKFYVTAFRNTNQPTAYLVGNWVELENYQIFYSPQYETNFSPFPFHDGYMLEYNCFETEISWECVIQLWGMAQLECEIWLEKISIIDSDFNPQISWLNPNYENNIRDIVRPLPPEFPDITLPQRPNVDPNNPITPLMG
jgi:hypothetical protein